MNNILLLYAVGDVNRTFSYQVGWPQHLAKDARFRCISLNVMPSLWQRIGNRIGFIPRKHDQIVSQKYSAVIILHSVFSNSCYLRGNLLEKVRRIDAPKAYFIGNEYKLMPEKMAFCEHLNIKLLVTMTPNPVVHALYRERLGCRITNIPSAGLDKNIFYPTADRQERPIDIGFRAEDDPLYLGHQERRTIAEFFIKSAYAYNLKVDIAVGTGGRFTPTEYALFLNRCKGQIATEAGTDYFSLSDHVRNLVNDHVKKHSEASLQTLKGMFFSKYESVPARMISGRIVEAAGTKTVQILFEGRYNDYFKPDVHYIALKKDFSNFDEVMEKFCDENYCRSLTDNAYEVAVKELTYEKLIDKFYEALAPIL